MSDESPFKRKKVIFKKEDPCLQAIAKKAIVQLDETFLKSIPSDDVKQLPPSYLYPVGALVILVLISIFVAVFVPGYESQIRTKFLSPVGSGNSRYCDDVTISNTGSFLATKTGYWQGSKAFAYSNASYTISLVNVQMDDQQFYSFMMDTYKQLVTIGEYTKTQNLGINLLYWMSWVSVGVNEERYTMTGTPLLIFNKEHTVGTISNVQHDCNESAVGTFNPSTGIMEVSFELNGYYNNPSCAGNGDVEAFGYSNKSRSNSFAVNYDIRTLVTAVAVNSNVTNPLTLQLVESVLYPVNGTAIYSASYVDPRYPGMDPVLCIHQGDVPSCVLDVGSTYGIPVFNHIGSSYSYPSPCNCSVEVPLGINNDYDNPCNKFNFLSGFIYWPGHPNDPNPAIDLMLRFTSKEIYDFAFMPMFTAGAYGMSSSVRDTFNSPEQRADMYEFCDTPTYGPCSIVTFSSYDSSFDKHVVSPNFYSIDYGACSDTMSTTPENWRQLVEVPFAPLTQQYQTCRNDPFTAFVNQAGVSAGNVGLLSPAGVLLVLCLLAAYQHFTGRVIPRTYSSAEKESALNALAVALLLIRDQRVRVRGGTKAVATSNSNEKQPINSIERPISGGNTGVSSKSQSAELDSGELEDPDAYDVHLLAALVEQLGNLATASESSQYMYRQEPVGEAVTVDWAALSAKVSRGTDQVRNTNEGVQTEMVSISQFSKADNL